MLLEGVGDTRLEKYAYGNIKSYDIGYQETSGFSNTAEEQFVTDNIK
jgi:hypothetical protein